MSLQSEFADPPVVEMAIGIQFRPVPELRGINLAPLAERWRDRYPVVAEQPPIAPAIEGPPTPGIGIQLGFTPGLPATRYWFTSEDTTALVQVQPDRLIVNWREGQSPGVSKYPRYPRMREVFESRATELSAFLEERHLGPLVIVQAEVNYINAIRVVRADQGRLERVLRAWTGAAPRDLGQPEEARASLVFQVPDVGRPPVRMFVSADPAEAPDGSPAWFLTLMVRGAPAGEALSDALQFVDGAHDRLLTSFMELTPESMHAEWGLRR